MRTHMARRVQKNEKGDAHAEDAFSSCIYNTDLSLLV
jgi:hypothetical protein